MKKSFAILASFFYFFYLLISWCFSFPHLAEVPAPFTFGSSSEPNKSKPAFGTSLKRDRNEESGKSVCVVLVKRN